MFATTLTTDIYNGSEWEGSIFVVQKLDGAVGVATVTCLSCDDTTPTNDDAVLFKYRYSTTPDIYTAWAEAGTTAGVSITAGASATWEFAVNHSDGYKGTETAPENRKYFKWVCTETSATAVNGSAFCMMYGPKYGHEIPNTVLT